MVNVTIDGRPVTVSAQSTILEAARQAGVLIPTLCFLEDHLATGACRVCVVEVEGAKALVASCATPVQDRMKVWTHSRRVRQARRAVVEMLLSEHCGDCQTCERSEDCELSNIAREVGISALNFAGERAEVRVDDSTFGLIRDNAKCIKCRRCVTVCNQVQGVGALFPQFRGFGTVIGPAFASDLADVTCVQCGQCAAVCPVGAITEKTHLELVWDALDCHDRHVVVQTAPAVRASLGECFGMPPGTLVTGKMVAALRRLGFDSIFDTNFTADLTIIEEAMELLQRLKQAFRDRKEVALPQFTSCSPGWINYAEHFYPQLLPNISTCKSPQQMFGAVAKSYLARRLGKGPEDMFVVSVMPCIAKKFEAQRSEMNSSGVADVDAVLTTRELGRMIKQAGIDFASLPDEEMDRPLGVSTGAADIFASSGGVMEAALRSAFEVITGRELPFEGLHIRPIEGLEGIKRASITIEAAVEQWSFLEGVTLNIAVVSGLGNTRRIIEGILSGEDELHFVEVMTCPGGCVGGGGQPRFTTDRIRKLRTEAIFREDEQKSLRKSHDNPKVKQIYGEFLGFPLGEKAHHLLHTAYREKERV